MYSRISDGTRSGCRIPCLREIPSIRRAKCSKSANRSRVRTSGSFGSKQRDTTRRAMWLWNSSGHSWCINAGTSRNRTGRLESRHLSPRRRENGVDELKTVENRHNPLLEGGDCASFRSYSHAQRRSVMRIITWMVIGCLLLGVQLLPGAIPDPVKTDYGLVSGTDGTSPDVRAFKGIPFAAPPLGPLRWQPPQPPAAWNGVRKADQFGPRCMQAVTGVRGGAP